MSVPHYQTPPVRYAQPMAPHFGMPSVAAVNLPYAQLNTTSATTPAAVPEKEGKASTVFVGNISESAPDDMIRAMLNTCGFIVNWKRAQGSSGKMQGFGFCTYQDPEAAIRAIKMLHNLEVGGKALTVKVDENTKEYLENYKKDKSGDSDQQEDQDRYVKQALVAILKNSESKLTKKEESDNEGKDGSDSDEIPKIPSLKPYQYTNNPKNQKLDLDDLDVDDSRKNLISQEISKFRESYKNDEGPDKEEIEREIKRREKEKLKKRKTSVASDRDGSSTERKPSSKRKSRDRDEKENKRKKSRERSPKRSSPSRRKRLPTDSPSPVRERIRRKEERRERSPGRDRDRGDSVAARRRERERERERDRDMRMSSSRRDDRDRRSMSKDRRSGAGVMNAEEEEERREEEKLEKKLKEKEAAYQERLKIWETREKKKIREAEKDRERERDRIKEQIKEAKRLKEFLEEYDDQKEDMRFYTSTALNRRLRDREKEKEIDERDRLKEKEELDEILQRLREEGNPDPEAEVAKIVKEFEENMNKPLKERERELKDRKKKKDLTSSGMNSGKNKTVSPPVKKQSKESSSTPQQSFSESSNAFTSEQQPVFDKKMTIEFGKKSTLTSLSDRQNALSNGDTNAHQLVNNYDSPSAGGSTAPTSPSKSPPAQNSSGGQLSTHTNSAAKKKKLQGAAASVFADDDDDAEDAPKKRKLIPLDAEVNTPKEPVMTPQQKQQKVKELIAKIPTDRNVLFKYPVDWEKVDEVLMEERIKQWVNKKIQEYIGEEELTLVEFICGKVKNQCNPETLLNDVKMVLDDEAEVFIVKLWRLLIYETEAKKQGLSHIK